MKQGEVVLETTLNGERIVIRYPTMEDVDILLAYINELSTEQTYVGAQGEQHSREDEEKYVKSVLENMEKNFSFQILLFCDGKLSGGADVQGNRAGAVKYLAGLGIALLKPARGKGLGTLLMQTLLNETRKDLPHVTMVKLSCFGENVPGSKLYAKFGFKEYGRLPGGFIRKGEPHDRVYMYKRL